MQTSIRNGIGNKCVNFVNECGNRLNTLWMEERGNNFCERSERKKQY